MLIYTESNMFRTLIDAFAAGMVVMGIYLACVAAEHRPPQTVQTSQAANVYYEGNEKIIDLIHHREVP